MKLAARIATTLVGLLIIWLAVTMAVSPALIMPVPEHGEAPQRVLFEPTWVTELSRYIAAGLLAFFGLTLAVAPWRRRQAGPPPENGQPRQG